MKNIILVSLLTLFSFVASANTVVIVNKANTSEQLKVSELRKIFLAKKLSFDSGETITPLLNANTTITSIFLDKVTRKTSSKYRSYFAKLHFTGGASEPQKLDSAAMLDKVSKDVSAIGIIDKSEVTDSVKVVYEL